MPSHLAHHLSRTRRIGAARATPPTHVPRPLAPLQAVLRASILAAAASSPRNSHDDNMSMTSSPRSDACKKGEEIPFDPLDVGATPSFDEIFA